MTKWNRIYKSKTHNIYVYERPGMYKSFAYGFYRVFTGEAAVKDLIQYVHDFGDTSFTIKETINV